MNYTGALNIKHKVQSRTLRANYPDSHYVACFFKMMKRLGVVAAQVIQKYTEDDEDPVPVVLYSMDDKANINVEEPHLAVGFGGRGRRSIMSTDVTSISGDHDFKIVSLTPSVTLRVDVKPDEGEDGTSYYRCVSHLPWTLFFSYFVFDVCISMLYVSNCACVSDFERGGTRDD
jgi:hypothetical protein